MKPHFRSLLQSNDALGEMTIREIKELIKAPSKELEDINAQLDLLRQRRQEIQESLVDYLSLLSPMRQVPNNILHEIFFHCLPTHRNSIISSSEAPILLTHVCKRWRSAALSSPRLWSRLHITFSDISRIPVLGQSPPVTGNPAFLGLKRRCEVVREWLARSRNCPLSISIRYQGSAADSLKALDTVDLTRELFRIVASYCERWTSLELVMPLEVYRIFDLMISSNPQSLTCVKLDVYSHGWGPYPGSALAAQAQSAESTLSALLKGPLLRKICLGNLFFKTSSSLFNRNITIFCSSMVMGVDDALELFRHCSGLIHCKLEVGPDLDKGGRSIRTSVELPHLLTLSITEGLAIDDISTQFYRCLHAPSLKWLDYKNQGLNSVYHAAYDRPPIIIFLERCSQLKKLTVDPSDFDPGNLRQVFEVVSHGLNHLALGKKTLRIGNIALRGIVPFSRFRIAKTFFLDWFLVNPDSAPNTVLLPNLRIFEWFGGTVPDKTVLRFVLERTEPMKSPGVAHLKRVHIIFDRFQEIDVAEEVKRRRKDFTSSDRTHSDDFVLDLSYPITKPMEKDTLPSSLGLIGDNSTWSDPDIDESVSDFFPAS